jgi:hypothetical protein
MKNNPNYIGDVITIGELYFSESFLEEHLDNKKIQEFKDYSTTYLREQREKFEKEYQNHKHIHPLVGGDYFIF